MVHKFISSKNIIAKVSRDLNMTEEPRWLDMMEWIAEAMDFIGAYAQYYNKTISTKIIDGRVEIPKDLYKLQQIKTEGNVPFFYATNSFHSSIHTSDSSDLCKDERKLKEFIQADGYTYVVNSPWIVFSIERENIDISYLAVPSDEEGFPLIPDDSSFTNACFFYILRQLILGGFKHPEFNFDRAHGMWEKYCGQARASAHMPDLAKLESMKEQSLRLIPYTNAYTRFFKDMNDGDVFGHL